MTALNIVISLPDLRYCMVGYGQTDELEYSVFIHVRNVLSGCTEVTRIISKYSKTTFRQNFNF